MGYLPVVVAQWHDTHGALRVWQRACRGVDVAVVMRRDEGVGNDGGLACVKVRVKVSGSGSGSDSGSGC